MDSGFFMILALVALFLWIERDVLITRYIGLVAKDDVDRFVIKILDAQIYFAVIFAIIAVLI